MKRKRINKKLVLNKSTVANLEDDKMNKVRGGTLNTSNDDPCNCNTSRFRPCQCNTSDAEPCNCTFVPNCNTSNAEPCVC